MRAIRSRSKSIILTLKEGMLTRDSYERSMRQALARKPFLNADGRYVSREEVHVQSGPR
jgi:hypothetical protein